VIFKRAIEWRNRLTPRQKTALSIVGILIIAAASGAIISSRTGDEDSFPNNILLFALVNLNILALLVLVLLVGRNVVKLIFERRRGILGSKLRMRLVGAFVLLACVPMSISFLVSSGLINEAMEGWFNTQIDTAVTGAVSIARQHLTNTKSFVRGATERVQSSLREMKFSPNRMASNENAIEQLRHNNDLFAVRVLDGDGQVIVESTHATSGVDPFKEPRVDREALKKAINGEEVLRIEERGSGQFIRTYSPLGKLVLLVTYRMDPEILQAQAAVNESFHEYEQLKQFRHPLKSNFMLTLALFNLLSLFGAIWVAFFIAKQITGPIQHLAEGTKNVARGMYDFQLDPIRDDEMGFLVTSFNRMLLELKGSRDEAERRGLLIETILANLAVGVVALAPDKSVTTVNSAAGVLLQIDHIHFQPGEPLQKLIKPEDFERISPLLVALDAGGGSNAPKVAEVDIRIHCGGRELMVVCTAGRIVTSEGTSLGYVLLFDDVTDISRAQHLAAWRDVARRIAHEIKNPLTPIQLSAQRLERLLASSELGPAVEESTRTIVEHVTLIKRLANEFSEYGRMPTATFGPTDLGALVTATVQAARGNHPDVQFSVSIEGKLPEMLIDAEQVRGVIINLVENAAAAVRSEGPSSATPEVRIRMYFDRSNSQAVLEVSDNGPGIPAAEKNRIFEPYFTTKKGGTGLGLAIASSIVSDHEGEIRVFDNYPTGAKFIVTLPQYPRPSTVRKLYTA